MKDVQEFLHSTGQSLGINEETTRSATGGLLQLIKQHATEGDFSKLLGSLPGAEDLMNTAPDASGADSGAAGLLGGLGTKVASALGGGPGSAASALALFKQSGLDTGQARDLVTKFFDFAKARAGSELVGSILGKLPEIKKLMG
ncbi:MAG: DUF2780 domain-containing protein [Candidatus Krumholzibacteria bacterium]|nr:DUF2780 domain-containing protein [Candidatus Krumholzibacteria bacterium]